MNLLIISRRCNVHRGLNKKNNMDMGYPSQYTKLTASTATTTDRDFFRYRIDNVTREEELQATIEAIDRYLDEESGFPWYAFGRKTQCVKSLGRAVDHVVHILKTYEEGEKIR